MEIYVTPKGQIVGKATAWLKAKGRIAYADCFAGALAMIEGCEWVTGDRKFIQFEDQIQIAWV